MVESALKPCLDNPKITEFETQECRQALSTASITDMEQFMKSAPALVVAEKGTKSGDISTINSQFQPLLQRADWQLESSLHALEITSGVNDRSQLLKQMQDFNAAAIKADSEGQVLRPRQLRTAQREAADYFSMPQGPEAAARANLLSNGPYGNYFKAVNDVQMRLKSDPVVAAWGKHSPAIGQAIEPYANYANALRNKGFAGASDSVVRVLDHLQKRVQPLLGIDQPTR